MMDKRYYHTYLIYTFIGLLITTVMWMWTSFCMWIALYMDSILCLCERGFGCYVNLLFDKNGETTNKMSCRCGLV